jgi:hypothetical protein
MISWKKVYSKSMKFFINLFRVVGIIAGLVILWAWLFNGEELELWHKAMALLLVFGSGADLIIEWRKR